MRHVISALVENKVGVLAHIAGLFSSRGFNIDSLTVGRRQAKPGQHSFQPGQPRALHD